MKNRLAPLEAIDCYVIEEDFSLQAQAYLRGLKGIGRERRTGEATQELLVLIVIDSPEWAQG